jgi:hypothetical protein
VQSKWFKEERGAKVNETDLDKAATLESNKSH